eukprot:gene8316-5828_t
MSRTPTAPLSLSCYLCPPLEMAYVKKDQKAAPVEQTGRVTIVSRNAKAVEKVTNTFLSRARDEDVVTPCGNGTNTWDTFEMKIYKRVIEFDASKDKIKTISSFTCIIPTADDWPNSGEVNCFILLMWGDDCVRGGQLNVGWCWMECSAVLTVVPRQALAERVSFVVERSCVTICMLLRAAEKGLSTALRELAREKLRYDAALKREEGVRRAKLRQFLTAHQAASQWATCLAALMDAREYGVTPTDDMLEQAIQRCGASGRLRDAKHIYTQWYKELHRPRPLSTHVSFMEACAACGDFTEAKGQLDRLVAHDVRCHAAQPGHRAAVTDDLVTAYLRTALAAHLRGRGSTPPTWEVALGDLVRLRNGYPADLFRPRVELTPLLLEAAAQLADVGGQWEWALRLLESAARAQALVPSEAYDAAVRVCYRHQRHGEVVRLLQTMIATKSEPDERSVRLGLVSAEEVEASEALDQLVARPKEAAVGVSTSTTTTSSTTTSSSPPSAAWALSLQLFEAMRLNGLPLYQQCYEAPLRACVAAGRWEGALRMLAEMRRDGRPVSSALYRHAVAARIAACDDFAAVERLLRLETLQTGDGAMNVLYLAALRWCVRHADWRHLARLSKEMRDKDLPESYDKVRVMMEAAYHQQQFHAVAARFARFYNITAYEQGRTERDGTARSYPADFHVPLPLLDLVIDACGRLEGSRDPLVEVARRTALEIRQRRHSGEAPGVTGATETPDWMHDFGVGGGAGDVEGVDLPSVGHDNKTTTGVTQTGGPRRERPPQKKYGNEQHAGMCVAPLWPK